jgi:uncharacterized protein with PQ loop repeat
MLTALLGWIIAAASSLTLLPILLRVLRTRDTTGVSAPTAGLASLAMLCWSGYTWSLRDWPAFASSVGPLAIWSTLLIALLALRRDAATLRIAAGTAATASVLVIFAPSSLLAVLAVAGSVGWALPQLRTAFSSAPLTGVSVPGYALVAAENLGWIVYGFATGHLAYVFAPAVQAPATALIAYRAHRSRRFTVSVSR